MGIGKALRRGQHRALLGRAANRAAQNEIGAKQGRQHGSRRIHRLHQIKPRGGGLRRADNGDIGIGRHLQQGNAAGDDKQHGQRHLVGWQAGRQNHAQRTHGHNQQADDQRFLIANPLDQLGRGDGGEEIGDEPYAFDQRGLGVIELEHAAQMRQQRVVDNRDEAPHEEQAGQQRQR